MAVGPVRPEYVNGVKPAALTQPNVYGPNRQILFRFNKAKYGTSGEKYQSVNVFSVHAGRLVLSLGDPSQFFLENQFSQIPAYSLIRPRKNSKSSVDGFDVFFMIHYYRQTLAFFQRPTAAGPVWFLHRSYLP